MLTAVPQQLGCLATLSAYGGSIPGRLVSSQDFSVCMTAHKIANKHVGKICSTPALQGRHVSDI